MDATEAGAGAATRREVLAGAAASALTGLLWAPSSAPAASLKSVNARLQGYGLPTVEKPPGGMSPLLEVYGRDTNRETLLVGWNYPSTWIVERPSLDRNSEDGTVATGDYQKGDTAFFFVGSKDLLGGSTLSSGDKALVTAVLQKAISQKGDNQYQSFKLKSVREGATAANGQKYYVARFSYELLTGAGFTVDREGCASLTTVGSGVQALVAATTAKRFKKLQPELEEIATSFRVYNGI
ncbi:unnamed protein product, partial [Phaeothamnion confervicola]